MRPWVDFFCMLSKLLIMKNVLPGTVSAIALTFCVVSFLTPSRGFASGKTMHNTSVFSYADVLKNTDTVTVDANFKIIGQVSETSHRFHFTIQKTGAADLASANITADFTIGNGFVSAYDALKVAQLVVDKMKAGNAASITKAELEANNIPQTN